MDEDLKRVAEAADRFVNGLDPRGGEVRVSVPALKLHFERTLSAAAERERELVEALRPFAGVAALLDDGLTYSICTEDGAVIVEDDDFRNAARVV
jgi:hypothetical protein